MSKKTMFLTFQLCGLGIAIAVMLFAMLTMGTKPVVQAQGTTFYVSSGGNDGNGCLSQASPCGTISAALSKANNNDIIIVNGGTYGGSIVVDKAVTIRAEPANSAIIEGNNEGGWGFHVASDGATIDGFSIQNFGDPNTGTKGYGIYAPEPVNDVTISNNSFSNITWAGIFVWSNGSGTFDDWTIQNNTVTMGSWSPDTHVYGIECTNCVRATISGNTVGGAYVGILLSAQTSGDAVVAEGSTLASNEVSNASFANIQIVSFDLAGATGPPTLQNVIVQDNTLSNDGSLSDRGNRAIIGYPRGGGLISGVTIQNNTLSIINADGHHTDIRSVAQLTVNGNQITVNGGATQTGLTALQAGSGFVGVNLDSPTVTYNFFTSTGTDALAFYCNSCASPNVSNNIITVQNPIAQSVGWRNHVVDLYYASGSVNVSENQMTVNASASGDQFIHGVNVQGNLEASFSLERNILSGSGTNGAGLRLRTPQNSASSIQASENVVAWQDTCVLDDDVEATIKINLSSLECSIGLETGTSGSTVDATENWWGHETGPNHSSNPTGQGNLLIGDALFSPCLPSGEDTDPSTPGFQPGPGRGCLPEVIPTLFLPIIIKDTSTPVTTLGPDLVVSRFIIEPPGPNYQAGEAVLITVDVTNQGDAPATPFWVDLFINPLQEPVQAGTVWTDVCTLDPCFGIVWEVTQVLNPGETVTLQSTAQNYDAGWTSWPGWFISGTNQLYVYADNWGGSRDIPHGGVVESDETNNRASLNISVTGTNPPPPAVQSFNPFPRPAYPRESQATP